MNTYILFMICLFISLLTFPIPIAVANQHARFGVFNPFHLLWVLSTLLWISLLVIYQV